MESPLSDWNLPSDQLVGKRDQDLLDVDLRKQTEKALVPELIEALQSRRAFSLNRSLVLQVQRCADVTRPSAAQRDGVAADKRLLMLTVTDGVMRAEALEYPGRLASFDAKTKLGCKLRVRGLRGDGGFLFLDSSNTEVLGGSVHGLGRTNQLKEEVQQKREADQGIGAPPFVPLENLLKPESANAKAQGQVKGQQHQHQKQQHLSNQGKGKGKGDGRKKDYKNKGANQQKKDGGGEAPSAGTEGNEKKEPPAESGKGGRNQQRGRRAGGAEGDGRNQGQRGKQQNQQQQHQDSSIGEKKTEQHPQTFEPRNDGIANQGRNQRTPGGVDGQGRGRGRGGNNSNNNRGRNQGSKVETQGGNQGRRNNNNRQNNNNERNNNTNTAPVAAPAAETNK